MEFSEWYSDILEKAEIYDVRYPIKGCGVYLPYGFKIRRYTFEIIRKLLDESGHDETLFPMLIPEDLLAKEAEHIKGFEDEVYWVTHGGKTPLDVKLALRPTSETPIYYMMKLWVKVHTDLPIKIYQIVNTFRYETKHTRPLIRLREIMTFKEAHTAHSTKEEAEEQVKQAISIYKKFFDALGIPYLISKRPEWDKFPGAEYTMAFDTIFPDGRTMQIATVHNLGQNFAKTFEIIFETPTGDKDYAYQTCYGISDRGIASIIAIHGDEKGLILPPIVAPIQIVIVPLIFKGKEDIVMEKAKEIYEKLKDKQKEWIKYFAEKIKDVEFDALTLHELIYQTAKELGLNPRDAFQASYMILLGKRYGPKLGAFLATLGRDFVIKRYSLFE